MPRNECLYKPAALDALFCVGGGRIARAGTIPETRLALSA